MQYPTKPPVSATDETRGRPRYINICQKEEALSIPLNYGLQHLFPNAKAMRKKREAQNEHDRSGENDS